MPHIRPALLESQYGLARRFAAHRHFRRMMDRQDIDIGTISWSEVENAIYRAVHNCTHCRAKPACTEWFGTTAPAASYVRFCPNAETMETLRIMASPAKPRIDTPAEALPAVQP